MVLFIFGVFFAALALMFLALSKTYQVVPAKELKRRARHGDAAAMLLYKPVSYGLSLVVLLWIGIGFSLAASVVLFAHLLPTWLAIIFVVLVVWIGFAWIPNGDLTNFGLWMARRAAPPIAWLLERLHPIFVWLNGIIQKHRPIHVHTGLYEKSDLAELLEDQKAQPDSRISAGEIDLLVHALTFGDKLVGEAMIPKRVVSMVKADEPIGPLLMEELHKIGHSRYPVYDGKKDNIIGILYLRDLIETIHTRKSGTVADLMKRHISYVHEDFTLYQTLQAFLKTKHHLFLVINEFEEFVGIITIEDVIEQMVGKVIVDEFDAYEDLRAVAATAAKKEHDEHKKEKQEPVQPETVAETDETVVE